MPPVIRNVSIIYYTEIYLSDIWNIILGVEADETYTLKKEQIKPVEFKPVHPIDEQFEIFKRLEERKLVDHNTSSLSDKRPKNYHDNLNNISSIGMPSKSENDDSQLAAGIASGIRFPDSEIKPLNDDIELDYDISKGRQWCMIIFAHFLILLTMNIKNTIFYNIHSLNCISFIKCNCSSS